MSKIYIIRDSQGAIWTGAKPKVAWTTLTGAKLAWGQKSLHYDDQKRGWVTFAEPQGFVIEELT